MMTFDKVDIAARKVILLKSEMLSRHDALGGSLQFPDGLISP
jgi:hypothetical protein